MCENIYCCKGTFLSAGPAYFSIVHCCSVFMDAHSKKLGGHEFAGIWPNSNYTPLLHRGPRPCQLQCPCWAARLGAACHIALGEGRFYVHRREELPVADYILCECFSPLYTRINIDVKDTRYTWFHFWHGSLTYKNVNFWTILGSSISSILKSC